MSTMIKAINVAKLRNKIKDNSEVKCWIKLSSFQLKLEVLFL